MIEPEAIIRALEERSGEIAERWLTAIRADPEIPTSQEVPEPLLGDSVPQVLPEVLSVAVGERSAVRRESVVAAREAARDHGRRRAAQDFDPRELVREYQLLRRLVFEAVQEAVATSDADAHAAVVACRRLGAALDEALRETIGAFVEEQTDELRRRSRMDSLTGLLNHRSFYEELSRELSRAQRTESVLSVALVDLDDFKSVNDRLGHQVGDRALVTCAQILRRRLRRADIVCRYGGDEFAVVLPDTPRALTESLLGRIAGGLRAEEGLAEILPEALELTWGVAERPGDGESPRQLVECADRRLLQRKRLLRA